MMVAASAGAQERPRLDEPVQPSPEGDAAISRLRSPFCPGLMLEVCPSPQAKLLRDTIQVMAGQGASADSLVAWMLANYGEEYRAVPRAQGSGLLAWAMPPLALVVGLGLVVLVLRHFRRQRESSSREAEPLSDEEKEKLDAAMEELKSAEEVPF